MSLRASGAARDRIAEITHDIEGMRDQRDEKMKRIAELQANNQQANEYEGVMVKGPQGKLFTTAQDAGVVDWVSQW
ncbi:unnamed protein product [Heligmosomoides polygyrus]|uniref:t-SNARE coiled-coil homology domain-containing protein n=1 Tax=Heligmosomoides polygyrus TaxID=6339 RepID=A0A183GX88_HELPZ|nr:unnamed protein product [Heligmosomoides polygyrus]